MIRCAIIVLSLQLLYSAAFAATGYPYRDFYTELNLLELADLKTGYDKGEFIIVDVRSAAEYNAIHIKSAVNIPYSNAKFIDNLRALDSRNPGKKIALYCNGITCIKSYKAAEDALYEGFQNIHVFDGGIEKWAKTYPSETLVQNSELTNPANQLISEDKFNKTCLDFETFKTRAAEDKAVVIDARDPMQRKEKLPGLGRTLHIPIDKFVNNIISKGNMKDRELYIFDQVGKQVNWLMYYLLENGYTDFFFLEGGATAVLKTQEYR